MTGIETMCPYCLDPTETAKPVDQELLDQFVCPNPDCTSNDVELVPACHEAPFFAGYCKLHGALTLICAACMRHGFTILVGRRPQAPDGGEERPTAIDRAEPRNRRAA